MERYILSSVIMKCIFFTVEIWSASRGEYLKEEKQKWDTHIDFLD
jgi:hypothetical protein